MTNDNNANVANQS